MAKEESLNPEVKQNQEPNYDEVLSNMSIEQKDNTIKQLDHQCAVLAQENIKLRQQMAQLQQADFYKMLEWNYKIAVDASNIFNDEFRKACAERIETAMTPVEEPNKEESNG